MARYLLLHGFGGIGPDHWLVWLSTELRARGHVARIRKLPTPNAPVLEEWLEAMTERLAHLGEHGAPATDADGPGARAPHHLDEKGDPSGDLVVVAHSLGGRLWLHHAQEGRRGLAVPDRVALVSPPLLPDGLGPTRFHDLDVARIDPARIGRSARVVVSGNDPFWPDGGAAAGIAAPLGLPVDRIGDHGHIEPRDGYGPWPGMLAWCLGETETISA